MALKFSEMIETCDSKEELAWLVREECQALGIESDETLERTITAATQVALKLWDESGKKEVKKPCARVTTMDGPSLPPEAEAVIKGCMNEEQARKDLVKGLKIKKEYQKHQQELADAAIGKRKKKVLAEIEDAKVVTKTLDASAEAKKKEATEKSNEDHRRQRRLLTLKRTTEERKVEAATTTEKFVKVDEYTTEYPTSSEDDGLDDENETEEEEMTAKEALKAKLNRMATKAADKAVKPKKEVVMDTKNKAKEALLLKLRKDRVEEPKEEVTERRISLTRAPQIHRPFKGAEANSPTVKDEGKIPDNYRSLYRVMEENDIYFAKIYDEDGDNPTRIFILDRSGETDGKKGEDLFPKNGTEVDAEENGHEFEVLLKAFGAKGRYIVRYDGKKGEDDELRVFPDISPVTGKPYAFRSPWREGQPYLLVHGN